MTEVALYPVRSPEVTITRLQEGLNKGPLEQEREAALGGFDLERLGPDAITDDPANSP
jgi:hypothetical protein